MIGLGKQIELDAKELLRQPSYFLSTLIFPSMFFSFFALPNIDSRSASVLMTGSFASFGVIGVAFFQLAVSIAQEKHTHWSTYRQTLPVSPLQIMMVRLVTTLFFSLITGLGVCLTAYLLTDFQLPFASWVRFIFSLLFGAVSFCCMGLALGFWASPKNVLAIANLFYLPLSFLGGLWMPPNILPEAIQPLSEWLPTRFLAEIVWNVKEPLEWRYILGLSVYAVLGLVLAWSATAHDKERF